MTNTSFELCRRTFSKNVKKELIQMIDVKQRQKVCLTPVDANNKLLQKMPEKWEEIMDAKFMIINRAAQHICIQRAIEGRMRRESSQ